MFYVFEGLMLTIGSLLFVLLLCVFYFSKTKNQSIQNKIYRYMIIISVMIMITEIISSFLLYINCSLLLNLILLKIHWFLGIVFMFLLYNYDLVFLNNYDCKNLYSLFKLNNKFKFSYLLFILVIIIYIFIPFNNINILNINYIPGYASYFIIFYCIVTSFLILLETIKNNKNILKRKKIAVYLLVAELFIILIFQIIFPNISVWGLSFALQLFFLYFIIENPDLKVINNLKQINLELEKSKMLKSDFLSNMSHEIRTPMNAIIGFSQNLISNEKYDEKDAKEQIKNIYLAGSSLLDITNNILNISKTSVETLNVKKYKVSDLINELSSIINLRLEKQDVKFILEVDPKIPDTLLGDQTKVFQILLNILTNSVKYTEKGKIKLIINGTIIMDKIELNIKISDTGCGIKKEDYNKVFQKFSRLDISKNSDIEGSGLGLTIVKKYLDLMNGKIYFESNYGTGTTFYIKLEQKIVY